MEQTEDVESVPWSELLETSDPTAERRRIAYLAVGLVAAVVLGAVIARAWWAPSPPTIIAPAGAEAPVAADGGIASDAAPSSTTVPTVPLYSEADLMADPPDPDARAAIVRAEWFVTDYFTADYEPAGSSDVRAALPSGADLPDLPQDGVGGVSYVEWARAFEVQEVGDGSYVVGVVFRALAAPAEGSFVRLPVRAVEVHVGVMGEGASVLDLPRPVPIPAGPEPPAWPDASVEPPGAIVEVAAAQASAWGSEPRIVSAAEVAEGWRVVATVADGVGNRWPLSILVDG